MIARSKVAREIALFVAVEANRAAALFSTSLNSLSMNLN